MTDETKHGDSPRHASGAGDKAKDVTGDLMRESQALVEKAGGVAVSSLDKAKDVHGGRGRQGQATGRQAGDVAWAAARRRIARHGPPGDDKADG